MLTNAKRAYEVLSHKYEKVAEQYNQVRLRYSFRIVSFRFLVLNVNIKLEMAKNNI